MPANLTPQYHNAEERFREAKTTEEKIAALEEMYATIPKHKGTEKMRADIKKRLSKLRTDQSQKKKGSSGISSEFIIKKHGAAQVIIIGPPNSGKSSLLEKLTNAKSAVSDYPFTTRNIVPGMMDFENIQIQLLDTPSISTEFFEKLMMQSIRGADAVIIMLDLEDDNILEHLETILELLKEQNVFLLKEKPEKKFEISTIFLKALIIGNKHKTQKASGNLDILTEFYKDKFEIFCVSVNEDPNLDELRRKIFNFLEIIRVYTKIPGKKADHGQPFVLPQGATVLEVAETIHKDLAKTFKYAKIWGSERFDGQMVQRDYIVHDGDILEVH